MDLLEAVELPMAQRCSWVCWLDCLVTFLQHLNDFCEEVPYALPPGRFEDPRPLPADHRYEDKDYILESSCESCCDVQ